MLVTVVACNCFTDLANCQDLYGIGHYNTGSGKVEVHSVSASSVYQNFVTHIATAKASASPSENWFYTMADTDGDGSQDLVGVVYNTGSGFYEVHVLSGATSFQQYSLEVATPLTGSQGTFAFAMADVDRDGKPDLVCFKAYAGYGTVEVHVLSGASNYQNYNVHSGTPLPSTPPGPGRFYQMADVDLDGYPDVVCLVWNGGLGKLEIHVLSAASGYQQFILEVVTPMTNGQAFSNFNFAMGDLDHDGKPDLVAIQEYSTASRTVELYAVSGASNYQQFIAADQTAFGVTPNPPNFSFALGPVSPTVEVKNLTHPDLSPNFLVGDTYQYTVFGAPNQAVTAAKNGGSSEYLGQTDAGGRLVLTYVANANWVGAYTQVWSVGNQIASPTLTFSIGQVSMDGVVTVTGSVGVPASGNSVYQVSVSSMSNPITLTIIPHDVGVATFADNSTSMTISSSTSVNIHGVVASLSKDDLELQATSSSGQFIYAIKRFSVVSVQISMNSSGTFSSDDPGRIAMDGTYGVSTLDPQVGDSGFCQVPVEYVGTVTPSDYQGTIVMGRYISSFGFYADTSIATNSTGIRSNTDDTSSAAFRTDKPVNGKIYDVDASGSTPFQPNYYVPARVRFNFIEYALLDSSPVGNNHPNSAPNLVSNLFSVTAASSCVGQPPGFSRGIINDNKMTSVALRTTWNLQ